MTCIIIKKNFLSYNWLEVFDILSTNLGGIPPPKKKQQNMYWVFSYPYFYGPQVLIKTVNRQLITILPQHWPWGWSQIQVTPSKNG